MTASLTNKTIRKLKCLWLCYNAQSAITEIGKSLPYDIIYTYDILFISIFVVDDHSGADLDPRIASSLVEETKVWTHDLALLDYCGHTLKRVH